ncbi:hypothetical protein [Nocardia sp. NPDC004260]
MSAGVGGAAPSRAEEQAYELDQAAADAAMGHTDAQTDIDSALAMAEAQLTRFSWDPGRESTVQALTASIVWGATTRSRRRWPRAAWTG